MKSSFTLLISLLLAVTLFAQKAPIKWGKVDKADLDMKVYDLDPEAEAVVLADYGSLSFDFSTGNVFYMMDHHVRIKILKKSAFDRGDIDILFYTYQNSEKISGLKAQVILPNGDEVSVGKKDIFKENVNKYWSRLKFAAPSLEEGCIIEYKYTKRSDQIYYLEDWYFQSDIPTRLSEFRTSIPDWYGYVSFNQGLKPKVEKEKIPKKMTVPRQRVNNNDDYSFRGSQMSGGSIEANIEKSRYVVENAPALKRESFITTMRDYYSRLSLQLQYVKYPNSTLEDVTTTWLNVAKDLEKNPSFGHQLNKKSYTKQLLSAVKPDLADAKNDMDKVGIIYSYLSKNIEWNKNYGRYSSNLDKAFEKKSAHSGELNLMLVALCRRLKIEAYPVMISTRNHGKTMQYYPKMDQFNHLLAFVQVGEKQMLFDVGSPNRDPGLLRMESQNYNGWLVDGEQSQWIQIPSSQDTEIAMATLTLNESGDISGEINQSFKGYCAMTERTYYHRNKDKEHEHIKEEWQETYPDIKFNTIEFNGVENITSSLKCKLNVELPQAAQVSGDFIYLSPMMGFGYSENPLKQEKRTFPVDIPIQQKDQYILNLTVPDGFHIEELPEPINMKTEDGGATFRFLVSQNENKIQVTSKVEILKLRYEPKEYETIRNFFGLIVEKQGEQIVLKKKA